MTREDAGGADLERRARESILANAKLGIRAPDFGADNAWLNVSRPLSLRADLAGKVVLIDFWTFCCINCMHVLPILAEIEHRFAGRPFTVVGCHSAKFANEADAGQIRQAILRHDIAHPVVVDRDFEIWRSYAVRAWPTLMLVSPDGRLLAQISGEPAPEVLEALVGQALEVYAAEGTLDPRPLPLRRETVREFPRELAYPGKVAVDPAGERIMIADTGHHRIVEVTRGGAFLRAFGLGEPGLADGPAGRARFRAPQGMAFHEDALLVADTENHAVRRVDLATGEVTTLAGTGEQGHAREGRFAGREAALNSPWDLVVREREALIAMAGSHQIWRLDLATNEIGPLAGDGTERKADGPFEHAAFAQPSGLALIGDMLYVADSESSSVRAVNLVDRTVATLAGGNDNPRDLFHFGDEVGKGYGRRFQHPLGIAWHPPCLIVADSYNHKLKIVHPERGEVRFLSGTGWPGAMDGARAEASFSEPGGVAVLGDLVVVADTNNHRIRIVDHKSGRAETLVLTGVPVPMARVAPAGDGAGGAPGVAPGGTGGAREGSASGPGEPATAPGERNLAPLPELPGTVHLTPEPVRLAPGDAVLTVRVALPPGEKTVDGAPSQVRVFPETPAIHVPDPPAGFDGSEVRVPLHVEGSGRLAVQALVYHCGEANVCTVDSVRWNLEVQCDEAGGHEAAVTHRVEPGLPAAP